VAKPEKMCAARTVVRQRKNVGKKQGEKRRELTFYGGRWFKLFECKSSSEP